MNEETIKIMCSRRDSKEMNRNEEIYYWTYLLNRNAERQKVIRYD